MCARTKAGSNSMARSWAIRWASSQLSVDGQGYPRRNGAAKW